MSSHFNIHVVHVEPQFCLHKKKKKKKKRQQQQLCKLLLLNNMKNIPKFDKIIVLNIRQDWLT